QNRHHSLLVIFFFQAEDGIRDGHVTGVQTCALPIYLEIVPVHLEPGVEHDFKIIKMNPEEKKVGLSIRAVGEEASRSEVEAYKRSEERRVGKECRSEWWKGQEKKKERRKMKTGDEER